MRRNCVEFHFCDLSAALSLFPPLCPLFLPYPHCKVARVCTHAHTHAHTHKHTHTRTHTHTHTHTHAHTYTCMHTHTHACTHNAGAGTLPPAGPVHRQSPARQPSDGLALQLHLLQVGLANRRAQCPSFACYYTILEMSGFHNKSETLHTTRCNPFVHAHFSVQHNVGLGDCQGLPVRSIAVNLLTAPLTCTHAHVHVHDHTHTHTHTSTCTHTCTHTCTCTCTHT